MAPYARSALIAVLALGAVGCPQPEYRFPLYDLNAAVPLPASEILVGDHVVVRLEGNRAVGSGGRDSTTVHVFPDSAALRGTWVKLVRGPVVCEGSADVRAGQERRLIIEWWRLGHSPDCSSLKNEPDVRTTLWLGPVCTPEGCDTFRVDDTDGTRSSPPSSQ